MKRGSNACTGRRVAMIATLQTVLIDLLGCSCSRTTQRDRIALLKSASWYMYFQYPYFGTCKYGTGILVLVLVCTCVPVLDLKYIHMVLHKCHHGTGTYQVPHQGPHSTSQIRWFCDTSRRYSHTLSLLHSHVDLHVTKLVSGTSLVALELVRVLIQQHLGECGY